MQAYDIIVAGAGPGGSTYVRSLADTDLRIALIDKAEFPRDKVCGDAIPGTAVSVGKRMDADFWNGLEALHPIGRARGVAPGGAVIDLSYVTEGYACPRMEFDDYLVKAARTNPRHNGFFGVKVKEIRREGTTNYVTLSDGTELSAPLIVGADGAHSVVARAFTDTRMDRDHHCAAVRAYYRGVKGIGEDRLTFYFLKGFLPGYFWIFPLHDGLYNVGFGMLSRQVSERKIDLRESLERIVAEDPQVKKHFEGAEQVSKNQGFGLPLGSRTVPRSGDGFLLVGDAAGLVDPITGEGIGNAMISAELAARRTREAFRTNRLDADFLSAYDRAVTARLGKEFRIKHLAQRLLADRPWLINGIIRMASGLAPIRWAIKKVV